MSKVVIIAGSNKDFDHVGKIIDHLNEIPHEVHVLSAHKETPKLLELLKEINNHQKIVFITVAGKSNALSGVVACNTKHVVIACPPFASLEAYMIDIHSTLRMPSKCPVLTIIDPENCALAVKRILS
jgi:5-(carboxyamino)imidazole ribonucleotide mutase